MIQIENTEVYGWETAVRGMRNPMNSWDKSDSKHMWGKDSAGFVCPVTLFHKSILYRNFS